MPSHAKTLCVILLSLLLFPRGAHSQSPVIPDDMTGLLPNQTYGGDQENINFATGNLSLQLPLLSLQGRNGHDLNLALVYDSKIWNVRAVWHEETGWFYSWVPQSGGWNLNVPQLFYVFRPAVFGSVRPLCTTDFALYLNGSPRAFGNYAGCTDGVNPMPFYNSPVTDATDGSFLRLDTSSGSEWVVRTKDGLAYHFNATFNTIGSEYANKIEDTNGNVISIVTTTSGLTINDTVGRTITVTFYQLSGGVITAPETISYKDSNGQPQTITINYFLLSLAPTFASPSENWGPRSFPWPSSVTLPNNAQYTFQHNNFGELTKITYPTGGYTRYDFTAYTHSWYPSTYGPDGTTADFREVSARHVCRDPLGGCTAGTEETTTYTPTVDWSMLSNQYMDVRDATPDHNRTRYQFSSGASHVTPDTFSPREIMRWIYQGESTLLRTIQTDYTCFDQYGNTETTSQPIRVTTTLNDTSPALVTKTEADYDSISLLRPNADYYLFPACGSTNTVPIDNVIERREYDYGSSVPLRTTDYTWLKTNPVNAQDYTSTAIHILGRKLTETIYFGSATPVAQSQFEYDNFTENLAPSGAVQHDSGYGTGYVARGNLTAVQRWRNTDGAWLTTRNQYDDAGNVLKTVDPLNHSTIFSYADSWGTQAGANSCAPTGGNAAAYPTSITNAQNQVTVKKYYSCSGMMASITDPNSQTTTFAYDLMNRLTQKNLPDGGQTTLAYNDTTLPLSVTKTSKITSGINLITTTTVDGLGPVVKSTVDRDPDGQTIIDTTYDAIGRKATVSNPHRSSANPTDGITTYQYDALSRVIQVAPPDGTTPGSTCLANNVCTSYLGNTTTVSDQAGKKRKSVTDALGRLIQVFEPDASNNLVNETDYQYDALDNLLRVDQKGNTTDSTQWRTRTFAYNSLSQLVCGGNPEIQAATCPSPDPGTYTPGTIRYTYDNDGNLLTKVAPAPNQTNPAVTVTTTYAYDALHRLTGKSYSDSTPNASYVYDQASIWGVTVENPIGRRVLASTAQGTIGSVFSYDAMGRVKKTWQCLPGTSCKSATYAYNLDGSLASLGYPSGRTVTYDPGEAGRALTAKDTTTTNTINYALSASYAPQGALSSLLLGQTASFAGINLNQAYNNRLQPATIRAWSTNATNPVALDLSYCFNANIDLSTNPPNCAATPVVNNGNVSRIANNLTSGRAQSFTYDELNRIKTAKTQATSGQSCWGETFTYDIWANLLSIGAITPQYTGCTQESGLSVAVSGQNQIIGNAYDAAGNMTSNPPVGTYTYNAENQLTSTAGVTYTYDGDGKRVQKSSGKLYWYGMGNDPLDESDAGGNITDEYVFFGGKRIARRRITTGQPDSFFYYFADHLGTSRVVTDSTGTVLDDSDFYPFGGERPAITLTSGNNYKFTGKERDSESGLDNFTARYFGSSLGRFMSPDPLAGHTEDPQTLNRYSYVRNNPLNLTDPTGLDLYLSCERQSATCQKVGDSLVQGQSVTDANGNKTFEPTVVTSASLQDPNSGNSGTVNENGVQITTTDANGNKSTSQGIFINNTPAADLSGSGKLQGFSFRVDYSNVAVGTLSGGTFTYMGPRDQHDVVKTLNERGAFSYTFERFGNPKHPGQLNFRFTTGAHPNLFDYGPSPHLLVPADPRVTVPVGPGYKGEFHVDNHTGPRHLACAVGTLGCN